MSSNCYNTGFTATFFQTPYQITASSINIQNIATGQNFIGIYSLFGNQFTVPTAGGLSSPVILDVINPVTGLIVDTFKDQITFSLGEVIQCPSSSETPFTTTLNGYSKVFGPVKTQVLVDFVGYYFLQFQNNINVAFQTIINNTKYSISATNVFIQQA